MEDTDILKIGLKPCATDQKEQNPGKKTSKAGSIYQLLNIYKLDIVSYIMQDRRYATLFFQIVIASILLLTIFFFLQIDGYFQTIVLSDFFKEFCCNLGYYYVACFVDLSPYLLPLPLC